MQKTIALITINSKEQLYSITEDNGFSAVQPNIIMALLKSHLEQMGFHDVTMDETLSLTIAQYVEEIGRIDPLLVGVICSGSNPSASTMSMVGAIQFFQEFNKSKKTASFVQGGHPSVLPQRTLRETGADFVVKGEGYGTIAELAEFMASQEQLCSPLRTLKSIRGLAFNDGNGEMVDTGFPELADVNTLAPVNWDDMDPKKYRAHNWHCFGHMGHRSPYGVIWTSFGCPYACEFCCINNVFGKRSYRLRTMSSVLAEIDDLVVNHGVENIKIMDELFVIDHPRMEEFYQGLKTRGYNLNMWAYARMDSVNEPLLCKLKSVGMNWVAYGIESVSDATLQGVSKRYDLGKHEETIRMTRNAGMNICADVIAGLWDDTRNDMQRTYDWCVSHNFEWLNIYPMFAYPGTPMYDKFISNGHMQAPTDWNSYALYGYSCSPMHSKSMSAREILQWRDEKFMAYHSRPEYLDMLQSKFGIDTRRHVESMVSFKLPRRLLEKP